MPWSWRTWVFESCRSRDVQKRPFHLQVLWARVKGAEWNNGIKTAAKPCTVRKKKKRYIQMVYTLWLNCRDLFFSRAYKKWYEWCQGRGEISSRHLYETHIAAGVRQWVLARGRESNVNTTDWWRTVKLPFVREKQEASCGRPSLSGWEETAGRKPHLQCSERLGCGLCANSCLSVSIGLAFWPEPN